MCTYTARDGKVNPDVRSLNDSRYAVGLPQMAINNAIAYTLTRSRDYSSVAASYIETFFLRSDTAMSPALNYGQVVRGPGKTEGSFMAILDWRGMVKVANAVQILRQIRAPDWTAQRDQAFVSWCRQYLHWLQTSPIGQKASRAAKCVLIALAGLTRQQSRLVLLLASHRPPDRYGRLLGGAVERAAILRRPVPRSDHGPRRSAVRGRAHASLALSQLQPRGDDRPFRPVSCSR